MNAGRGVGARGLWLILLLSLVAVPMMVVYAQQPVIEAEVVRIQGDGVVTVRLEAVLARGLNEIPAPVPALPATIVVTINGSIVPPLYVNNTIIVVSEADGARARVSYIAESTVSNGTIAINVTPIGEATLIVDPNIVLLSLPEGITGVQVEDNGTMIFTFTQPSTIRFTLSQAIQPPQPPQDTGQDQEAAPVNQTNETIAQPAENETQPAPVEEEPGGAANETAVQEQPVEEQKQEANETQPAPQPGAEQGGVPVLYIIAGLVVLAALISTALYLARRRNQGRNPWAQAIVEGPESEMVQPGLNEVDKQIIDALRSFGGELYQSDLQRLLGIPKTTLWRHIRKLADMGVVEVFKEGRANKVRLVKDDVGEATGQ